MDIKFNIHFLGNGSATPHVDRPPSSCCVDLNNEFWLIDCGENTQIRLLELGLKRSRIKGICITHLHADHYLGIFALMSSMTLDRRKDKLTVLAPSLLKPMIDMHLFKDGYKPSFEIDFIETDQNPIGEVYRNDFLHIKTIPLSHRIFCIGFKFEVTKTFYKLDPNKLQDLNVSKKLYKRLSLGENLILEDGTIVNNCDVTTRININKSFAYCSDTLFLPENVSYFKEVDILYHEATFLENEGKRASETHHSTAKQAAEMALNANVKKLIIGHFSSRYDDLELFLKEAQSVFSNTSTSYKGLTQEI